MAKSKNGQKNGASGASELHEESATATDDLGAVALPSSASNAVDKVDASQRISVKETLSGRRILVTGTTGFLGKVFVSMMLHEHPDIDQLYLLIRSSSQQGAEDRFYNEIAASGAFEPIRETHGADTLDWLHEKVTILCGDITDELLGVDKAEAKKISKKLDLIINSAGLTNFNPNLRHALEINTLSQANFLAFSRIGGSRAKVMHVSTCFVAGRVDGPSYEVVPDETHYPAYDDLGVPYDPEREVADCFAMVEHVEALAEDQERTSLFTKQARDIMRKRNLNPDDDEHLQKVLDEVKKKWIRDQLSQDGRQRADHWGWVNIYTYTKSLGERLLAKNAGEVGYTIFRPAVIESSLEYPQVGWNEGINTTAPIIYLSYKGHRFIPTRDEVNLDVIPVDTVAGSMLAVAAALIEGRADNVYHCGSSHLAPLSMNRLIELTTLAVRKLYDKRSKMPQWQKIVLKSLDSIPVAPQRFNALSAPGLARAARGFGGLLKKMPTRQMGGVGKAVEVVQGMTRQAEKLANVGEKIFELFLPFIYENIYTFRADNLVKLRAQLVEEEIPLYGCMVEDIDWRNYWLKVHVPGLDKFVFPQLEAKLRETNREVYTFKDLVELFESSTRNFADEVAFQHHAGGIVERYTYADVRDNALRAANALRSHGAAPGTAVLLVSENRPQWGMAYFGMLKAGAVAVPVDPESNAEQIANLVASSRASVVVMSNKVKYRLDASLEPALAEAGVEPTLVTLNQLFTLALPDGELVDAPDVESTALVHPEADLASLIFTSGTTGVPKGVMLTHKNFASLLASLEGLFRIGDRDGFLSVLPLHHTFEFTAGFLMPFSKGSTVTYMEELSGDELRSAMTSTRVTSLIGVPALWQLLHRRIETQLDEQGPAVRWMFDQLVAFNRRLRDRTGMNFGPTLFAPIHAAFGNKMRYMISGGASLPEDVLKTFYGLGFNLYEGYGLTEAAPVLTVNRPDRGLLPGSVGRPLDGIEIEIRDPDKDGVGEIVARGENVMLGYLDRPEETDKALDDGWLRTGDLGKLDHKGNLTIVGRSKEVIVTSGGKNVYPDELEELYGRCPDAMELAIVGLPDGQGSERVAALIRPDVADDASADDVAEVRQAIRDWIRVEGARAPSQNRIQVLRFWDEELPRTPTRKVKRKAVIEILERLLEADLESREGDTPAEDATWGWLDAAIAGLAGVDAAKVAHSTHFQDDLGFDSLMVVELASILESRELHVTTDQLGRVETVGQLRDLLDSPGSTSVALAPRDRSVLDDVKELRVPEPVAKAGKGLLYAGQMWAYDDFYDVDVFGKGNIPYHNPNVIVVANHSSHLDMGLVKYALDDFGRDIRALAAADYFFSNTARKTYFKHFTNLIPVERSGSVETSLGPARQALQTGETLLMFPEGTRSTDGKLRPFRRGLGYLVAEQRVDILPVWIEGTYRALPKGQSLPSITRRRLKVRIGQPVRASELLRDLSELSANDLYQAISDRAHSAVEELSLVGHQRDDDDDIVAPLFAELNDKFEQDQIDEQVTFYFTLGKVDDLKWTVIVDPEQCDIRMGKPNGGQADCVVKTSPELFRKIVQESYIPSLDEFMDGTIKTNSPNLLMQFQTVFRLQG